MTTREEIAAELRRRGGSSISPEDVAAGMVPPVAYQRSNVSPTAGLDAGETGDPIPVPKAADREYTTVGGGYVVPKPRTDVQWTGSTVGDLAAVGKATAKEMGRSALNVASGGATEKVAAAVKDAPQQADQEVTRGELDVSSPEFQALLARLNPEGGPTHFVRTPSGWVPGTRTDAQGFTQKDPRALAEALRLDERAGYHGAIGLEGQQAADRSQYEKLLEVQQNEMRATQEFKRANDELDNRYNEERQKQLSEMTAVQNAMKAVPNAPRTIAEKFKASGMEDKIRFGLAAAFSVLGGAAMRDGGRSTQQLLNTMQANIDRIVEKEKEQRAGLGERFKVADNIYQHVRQGMQDDRAALNITKALYYDAAANAVQQIATQYKMDSQSPQVSKFMEELLRKRQELILETAGTLQDQYSQTDKYQQGGMVAVGGGSAGKYKSSDLEKDTQEFSKELEKRGFNMGERAIGLYQQALTAMKKAGFNNDESFKRAFVALSDPQISSAKQAAVLVSLNPEQRKALQLIVSANKEQLKDASGKSVTANELVRDVLEKGGYSIDSLDQARRVLIGNRRQVFEATAGGFDPRIPQLYDDRKTYQEVLGRKAGLGGDAPQAVDRDDLERRVEGRLRK